MKKTLIAIFLIFSMFLLEGCFVEDIFKKEYTVEFETFSSQTIESMSVKENEEIELPSLEPYNGTIFEGWYTDSQYTSEKYSNTLVVTSDIKLYAKWLVPEDIEVVVKSNNDDDLFIKLNLKQYYTYSSQEIIKMIDPFLYSITTLYMEGEIIENVTFTQNSVIYSDLILNQISAKVTTNPKLEYFADEEINMDGLEITIDNGTGFTRTVNYSSHRSHFKFQIPDIKDIVLNEKFSINGTYNENCDFVIEGFIFKPIEIEEIVIYGEKPIIFYYKDIYFDWARFSVKFNNGKVYELTNEEFTITQKNEFTDNGDYDFILKVNKEVNGVLYEKETTISLKLYKTADKDDFIYQVVGNDIAISGLTEIGIAKQYIIMPDTIDGLKITNILDNAFSDNQLIREVSLSSYINHIGKNAFSYCSSLQKVTINNPDFNILNEETFFNCTDLSYINLSTITKFGKNALANCSSLTIEKIDLNNIIVEDNALSQLAGINEVVFGQNYTLGVNCFENTTIKSIVIPEKTSLIETDIDNNLQFSSVDYLNTIPRYTFNKKLVDLLHVKHLTLISNKPLSSDVEYDQTAEAEFADCTSLESVTFDNKVTVKVNRQTFKGCTSLTSLTFKGTSLETGYYLEQESFYSTSVTELVGTTIIVDKAFDEYNVITKISLQDGLFTPHSFEGSQYLKSIELKNMRTVTLDDSTENGFVFKNCPLLESVKIENIDNIYESTFEDCISLKEFTITEGLYSIGDNAFRNTLITELILPETLFEISDKALCGMNLSKITNNAGHTFLVEDDILYKKGINGKKTIIKALSTLNKQSLYLEDNIEGIYSEAFMSNTDIITLNIKNHNLIKLGENIVYETTIIKVNPFVLNQYNEAYPLYNFQAIDDQCVLDIIYDDTRIETMYIPFSFSLEEIKQRYFMGKKFLYWYYLEEVNGTTQEVKVNLPMIINESLQIYAKYEDDATNVYIKYQNDDYKDITSNINDFKFERLPSKDGVKFIDWTLYGQKINKFPYEVTKEEYEKLEIVASWEYTLNFNDGIFGKGTNFNLPTNSNQLTIQTIKSTKLPTPKYESYKFDTWVLDFNGDGFETVGTDIQIPDAITVGIDRVYKAKVVCPHWNNLIVIKDANGLKNATKDKVNYVIINDLNLSGFKPVDKFSADLNGLGHTISNFEYEISSKRIGVPTSFGIFRTNSGSIRNLNFINSHIKCDGGYIHDDEYISAGILCGTNLGTINNINFNNCSNNVLRQNANLGLVAGVTNNKIRYIDINNGYVYGNGDLGLVVGRANETSLLDCNIKNSSIEYYLAYTNRSIGPVCGFGPKSYFNLNTVTNVKLLYKGHGGISEENVNPYVGTIVGCISGGGVANNKVKDVSYQSFLDILNENYEYDYVLWWPTKSHNQEQNIAKKYGGQVGGII